MGLSERRACKLLAVDRSSYRYAAVPDWNAELRAKLVELARQKPRFGYRRLHVLLDRGGFVVNVKRVYRLYREEGLMVRRQRRKRLVRSFPMHACRHQYPGRSDGSCSLVLLHRPRPSPSERRVGTCIRCFEACSVFTRITTYMLTSRLNGSLHRRLRRLCCLCRRSDCYRVERTSSRAGLFPAEKQ
jgi:hypothetical protein